MMASYTVAELCFTIFTNEVHLVVSQKTRILTRVKERVLICCKKLIPCTCYVPNTHFIDLSVESIV